MAELFPAKLSVSIDRQIECVEREIAMRQRAYPRWVADGRLTQAKADAEINCMLAVRETLIERKNNV